MGRKRCFPTPVLEALVKFETAPKLSIWRGAAMIAALMVFAQPFAATLPVSRGLAQSGLGSGRCAATPLPLLLVFSFNGVLTEFEWAGPLLLAPSLESLRVRLT